MAIDVDREWLTLQEAAQVTGKRPSALRAAILRKKLERVKKETGATGDYWLIHHDELNRLESPPGEERSGAIGFCKGGDRKGAIEGDQGESKVEGIAISCDRSGAIGETGENDFTGESLVNLVTIEYYDQQREKWEYERSKLEQGLMMYRYKFEELDQQMKLLPGPVPAVREELTRQERRIEEAKNVIKAQRDARKQLADQLLAKELLLKEKEEVIKAEISTRETLASSLGEKEDALMKAACIIEETKKTQEALEQNLAALRAKLEEEERAREELKKAWEQALVAQKRPWWKKLMGRS